MSHGTGTPAMIDFNEEARIAPSEFSCARERISAELMTSDRKLKASREG